MPRPDEARRSEETAALLQAAYRYARSLTAHVEEAEDLVHEGWIRVVERYGPDVDRRLMFRTIRNLFIDHRRHARRHPSERFDEAEGTAIAAQGHAPGSDADPALTRALGRLRDVEREALFLSVIEGYTAAEIARLTDTPRGTVLSLVHRAKRKLHDWLDDEGARTRLVVPSVESDDR